MKTYTALALLLAIFIVAEAAPSSRRWRRLLKSKKYRPSDFRNLPSADSRRLLGPNGEGSFRNINLSPGALTSRPTGSPGTSQVRFIQANRPQLSGNFGRTASPPGRVPPSSVISVGPNIPPDPSLSAPIAEGIEQLSDEDKEKIALEFFVRANYQPNGLANKKDLVSLMQRNYGLPETGNLDDKTVTLMMAPRCGHPDRPANYQTFPNREKWSKNPVTYQFAGYTPDMSPCQVRNALKRAFRVWEEVTALDFVESDSDDADIIIYFGYEEHGDGYPFDKKNGLLAHAFTAGATAISGDTHFDEAEFWTLGDGRVFETYYGNSDGDPCVFPFIFEDQEYTTCTTEGRADNLEWCSTTRNYDEDGKFGLCPQETLFTYGGNGDGNPCKFPFIFQGKSYDACTFEGRSDGYRWCSTTSNFDDDTLWGFCPDRSRGSYGGNSDGDACVFPFTFNGESYSDCTVVGRSDFLPWCATTSDYDRDKKFGFCQDSGYSLFLVATHEFGHAIGLDHSFDKSALMYPMYKKFDNFQLPDDDRRGVQDLYRTPRTTPLRPLVLEKCGGDLQITDGNNKVTPTPAVRSTTLPRRSTTPPEGNPNAGGGICDPGPIDALLYFGREIFLFKGREFWRMYEADGEKRGPFIISEQWPGLPSTIDSIYKRPSAPAGDDSLVFFKGTRHWVYDGYNLRAGYPKRVTTLGLPRDGNFVVDASLNWLRSKDRKRTYFYVGNKYYRFNEIKNRIDRRYPKSISLWRSIPRDLEASMEHPTIPRKSLFVKNNLVYILHNYKVQVEDTIPLDVWLGCRTREASPAPIIFRGKDRASP